MQYISKIYAIPLHLRQRQYELPRPLNGAADSDAVGGEHRWRHHGGLLEQQHRIVLDVGGEGGVGENAIERGSLGKRERWSIYLYIYVCVSIFLYIKI